MTLESGGARINRKQLLAPMIGSALLFGFSIWASTFPLTGYQSITVNVVQALSAIGLLVCGTVIFMPEWFATQGTLLRFTAFIAIVVGATFTYLYVKAPTKETAKRLRTVAVCMGEYEGNCLPHDAYLPCGGSVQAWVAQHCSSAPSFQRINTRSGNRCGYSLDEVTCELK
jgi:hypothetical protein